MGSESLSGHSGESDWDFDDEDEFVCQAQSLFSEKSFKSIDEALQYDRENFGFDFRAFREQASPSLERAHDCHLQHWHAQIARSVEDHKNAPRICL